MLRSNSDQNAALPIANFFGVILGFLGLSTFLIVQSLTVFLPLLFAPLVCLTLCYLLHVAHRTSSQENQDNSVNAVKIDVI